jgi:hypothetical protein
VLEEECGGKSLNGYNFSNFKPDYTICVTIHYLVKGDITMGNNRGSYLLIGIFIILLVIAACVEICSRQQMTPKYEEFVKEFKPENVYKIIVSKMKNKVILKKVKDTWQVATYRDYSANEDKINELLDRIQGFNMSDVVSSNPEKQSIFEVTEAQGTQVKLYNQKDKLIVHFYVGKNGPDYNSTYIRKENSNKVILVRPGIRYNVSTDNKAWIKKDIFDFKDNDVVKLTFKYPDKTIKLQKDKEDKGWNMIEPEKIKCRANAVSGVISALASLRMIELAKEYEKKDIAEYGLKDPRLKIIAELQNGSKQILLIGNKDELDRYYVKREDKKYVYIVSRYTVEDLLMKEVSELKEEEKNKQNNSSSQQ